MTYLEIDSVTKIYDEGTIALEDISVSANRGEFVSIVGPSGCGKSTLLGAVAGLRPPSMGTVRIDGREVTGPHSVGMVFQAPALMPWRTVRKNVLVAPTLRRLPVRQYEARADELLAVTGLTDFADRMPAQLSGGMQQRVSLCRALVHDPDILLMDEPFGALDALTRDDMAVELLRVLAREGAQKTVLFVTHSIAEAVFLSDRVLVLSGRPAHVVRDIPSVLARPRDISMRASEAFGQQVAEIYELLHRAGGVASYEVAETSRRGME